MSGQIFERSSELPASADEAFAWHERDGAFERLTPPWAPVEVVEREGGIRDGGRVVLKMGRAPAQVRWVAEHFDYQPGRRFRDRQQQGPFALWDHTHSFDPIDGASCRLTDRIEFALPLDAIASPLGGPIVDRQLNRTFTYRHRITRDDLKMHARARAALGKEQTMNVLVSGASGLLGSALIPALTTGGHSVRRLVRSGDAGEDRALWDPAAGRLDPSAFDGIDAVVHLSGETVAGRWSDSKKRKIMDSRKQSTTLIAETIAKLETPPKVFVCASAIGYYGDRGDERLTEASPPGEGFLVDVVEAWEGATTPAAAAGVRVVNTRFGLVLSPAGGLLGQILTPFKLGLGGPLGSGRQYMSWVAVDDVVGAIVEGLTNDALAGPVNVTAPNPVTNHDFTKTLGRVLGRPTVFKVPAFAIKAAFGEFSQEALGSARVFPERLQQAGYEFRFAQLEDALRHLLGRQE